MFLKIYIKNITKCLDKMGYKMYLWNINKKQPPSRAKENTMQKILDCILFIMLCSGVVAVVPYIVALLIAVGGAALCFLVGFLVQIL